MSSLMLLKNVADWDAYRGKMAETCRATSGDLNWGNGPQQYPCLIASSLQGERKMLSCYIYVADAMRLLAAAGKTVAELQPPKAPPNVTSEHFRANSAHLIALVNILIGVGVTKPSLYEEEYVKALQIVDQVGAEQRDQPFDGKALLKVLPEDR